MVKKRDPLHFWTSSGTVLKVQDTVQNFHQTSGGSGFIYKGTGFVQPVRTHVTSHKCREFWIRNDRGVEEAYKINNLDVPLRESQKIDVLVANGYIVAIRNLSMGMIYFVTRAGDFFKKRKPANAFGLMFCGALIGFFVFAFLLGSVPKWVKMGPQLLSYSIGLGAIVGLVLHFISQWRTGRYNREMESAYQTEIGAAVKSLDIPRSTPPPLPQKSRCDLLLIGDAPFHGDPRNN
jgi:hypothetical protein